VRKLYLLGDPRVLRCPFKMIYDQKFKKKNILNYIKIMQRDIETHIIYK